MVVATLIRLMKSPEPSMLSTNKIYPKSDAVRLLKAPEWKEGSKCIKCQKTLIHGTLGRHHCRACGESVCASCSDQKLFYQDVSGLKGKVYGTYNAMLKSHPVKNIGWLRTCDDCTNNVLGGNLVINKTGERHQQMVMEGRAEPTMTVVRVVSTGNEDY